MTCGMSFYGWVLKRVNEILYIQVSCLVFNNKENWRWLWEVKAHSESVRSFCQYLATTAPWIKKRRDRPLHLISLSCFTKHTFQNWHVWPIWTDPPPWERLLAWVETQKVWGLVSKMCLKVALETLSKARWESHLLGQGPNTIEVFNGVCSSWVETNFQSHSERVDIPSDVCH